jgi:hypothetical protein
MAQGLIPIVSLADQLASNQDLDIQKTKSDSIIGVWILQFIDEKEK